MSDKSATKPARKGPRTVVEHAPADRFGFGGHGASRQAASEPADSAGSVSALGEAASSAEATAPGQSQEGSASAQKGFFGKKRARDAARAAGARIPGSVRVMRDVLGVTDEQFERYAGSHKNTVLFGLAGFVLALLIIFLGFWETLVIAIFVLVGVIIGQALDGDNGIVNFFRRYFGRR